MTASVGMQRWPSALHALVFSLGAMPLFIAGFLLTAGPKWLRVRPAASVPIGGPVALVVVGWALVIGAATVSVAGIGAGLLLCSVGWTGLVRRLRALRTASRHEHRFHFSHATGACALVAACLWIASGLTLFDGAHTVAGTYEATGDVRALARAGLWLGVLPVFVVATDRMLPFLSHGLPAALERSWPRGVFWIALTASWAGGADAVLQMPVLASIGADEDVRASAILDGLVAIDAALVCVVSLFAWGHWRRHRAARGPMVAMLLRAFGWWVFGWAAVALAHLPAIDPPWRAAVSAAALHTLGLGYLGATMLAMVTRVTVVQAGRSQSIDRRARWLEGVLHGSAAARVLASLLPVAGIPVQPALLSSAAIGWALVAIVWSLRHGRVLLEAPPPAVADFPPFPGAHRASRADSASFRVASVDR